MYPEFPAFKPLNIEDREFISSLLKDYKPVTSELSFTNFYIWRENYKFQWSVYSGNLLISARSESGELYGFPPVGFGPKTEAVLMFFRWMQELGIENPRIERADLRLVDELRDSPLFEISPQRHHFDYVYLREALATLPGNKYHSKKNHINAFKKNYEFRFEQLGLRHIKSCLDMAETWCTLRRCEDDLSLMEEWNAVREALMNYENLNLVGGVITIDGKVEAFSLGEFLNESTVVVHIEKANAEIRGLYALINQQCAEHVWGNALFINREQDLGDDGLRQAKLSYHPEKLIEKYSIKMA
ncbi:DUF2156 domain-containing protein [bacterium]|nr:DUF2156 domain-containing protein [bacterium]